MMDEIIVHRDLTVKEVKLSVNIKHPYSGDISISLAGPNGVKVPIIGPGRGKGNNLVQTFEGNRLADFIGIKSKGGWLLNVIDAAPKDIGSVVSWSLVLTLANSKKSEIFIKNSEELNSAQICHQGGPISELSAKVHAEHGDVSELSFDLVSPSGKIVSLASKLPGGTKEFKKTFTNELVAFHGEDAKGKWIMRIKDNEKSVSGHLLSWSLAIKTSKKTVRDDLTRIEGIGPKIKELLYAGGIFSFNDLAHAKNDNLVKILKDAGPRYQMHDPGSWPRQSKLAADGKWEELDKLQDELDGGK
jgi:subtilisin-like proprotein convertase family protein